MKRKRNAASSSIRRKSETLAINFTSLLAAVCRNHNPYSQSLLKNRLKQVRRSLVSENPQTLPSPLIALLPSLIMNKSQKIASSAAEIIGLVSLLSFDMNEMIAMDGVIVRELIRGAVHWRRSVAVAACNAVLDIMTTEIGRQRLLDFSAAETFMFGFCQVVKLPKVAVDSCSGGSATLKGVSIIFDGDERQKLIFDIVVTLINSCNREQLEKIQSEHSEKFLVYSREIWRQMRLNKKSEDSPDLKIEGLEYRSNMMACNLAETMFRLSMNMEEYLTSPLQQVSRFLFGRSDCSFRDFVLNRWEESSLVLKSSELLSGKENIFGPFVKLLKGNEAVSSFLSNSIPRMTSCLPFSSDGLNVLDFLTEVKETIGCPIIYQQDIRIVKTEDRTEKHFLPVGLTDCDCIDSTDVFNLKNILRCEEGYQKGYTIALRGFEFRFELIAAIADAIASMFGQPSVGVNLYLTPTNSQGLARHYDDHCVFVCQLIGEKQWKISEQPAVKLPRLYEPLKSVCSSHVESASEETICLLREGDVLYIPRGVAHEACTMACDSKMDECNRFSAHLTFGIEVEPPFEWEGFVHIALHCWQSSRVVSIDTLMVQLLHFSIRHIGHSNTDFRKACLAGASAPPFESDNWMEGSQRTIFTRIVNVISTKSSYADAFRELQAALHNQKDPFVWLENLHQVCNCRHGQSSTLTELYDLCNGNNNRQEKLEAAFMQTKSDFCDNVEFSEVMVKYKMLLDKYRKARKQYTRGMLSLHCFDC